jgi:hypothetical protein
VCCCLKNILLSVGRRDTMKFVFFLKCFLLTKHTTWPINITRFFWTRLCFSAFVTFGYRYVFLNNFACSEGLQILITGIRSDTFLWYLIWFGATFSNDPNSCTNRLYNSSCLCATALGKDGIPFSVEDARFSDVIFWQIMHRDHILQYRPLFAGDGRHFTGLDDSIISNELESAP